MTFVFRSLLIFLCISTLISCNVYGPFASNSTEQDYVDSAQKCLKTRDYDCAIGFYNAMPAGDLKNQKLCLIYLAKAGISLTTVLNTFTQAANTMLGTLANQLLPWSQTKQDALDVAATNCATYKTSATSAKAGQLLNALAVFSHCAIRISKTDTYFASNNLSATCGQSRTGNGIISGADIDDNSGTGAITAQGMCVDDVNTCGTDISSLNAAQLSAVGLTPLANLVTAITPVFGSGVPNTIRAGIYSTVP